MMIMKTTPTKSNQFILPTVLTLTATLAMTVVTGCGSHSDSHAISHKAQPVFKGHVAKVEYHLRKGYTVIVDADGKSTQLHGFPSVPLAPIEIYPNLHGAHGAHPQHYEVIQLPQS
jgi:hypothetical protein